VCGVGVGGGRGGAGGIKDLTVENIWQLVQTFCAPVRGASGGLSLNKVFCYRMCSLAVECVLFSFSFAYLLATGNLLQNVFSCCRLCSLVTRVLYRMCSPTVECVLCLTWHTHAHAHRFVSSCSTAPRTHASSGASLWCVRERERERERVHLLCQTSWVFSIPYMLRCGCAQRSMQDYEVCKTTAVQRRYARLWPCTEGLYIMSSSLFAHK